MSRDHSPDGLNYSVYADGKLKAKTVYEETAIILARFYVGTSDTVKVNQFDRDFSPHLGKTIIEFTNVGVKY